MDDLISRQVAIDTEGLDEQIRCEMCRNPMHTNRGCDGNCKYDEKLYEKIMQILDERIKPLPSVQPEQLVTCPIYSGMCGYPSEQCYDCPRHEGAQEKPFWWKEGNAQPDLTPDGTLNISVGVDVAKVGRILLTQTGTQEGGLYYKDAQPEPEELDFVQPHKTTGVKLEVPLADKEIVSRLRTIQMQVGGSYAIDRAIEIIEAVAERRTDD